MNKSTDPEVIFREEQQFRQKGLWILLLVTAFFFVFLFGYGMIRQLVLGQMWGDRPMSDTALSIIGTMVIISVLGFTYLFYAMKLTTEVRDDGLYLQFFPFSQKVIRFDRIKRCNIRTYSPLKEYGGWGLRYGSSGKAYNVSGNRGVQLEFHEGDLLLIGSQKPEGLDRSIKMQMRALG